MSEPTSPRPVPGPGPGVPGPGRADGERPVVPGADGERPVVPGADGERADDSSDRFVGLAQRPVSEHVEVFEAEHGRLQTELGTIDRL